MESVSAMGRGAYSHGCTVRPPQAAAPAAIPPTKKARPAAVIRRLRRST
jgi:hypothetical protein